MTTPPWCLGPLKKAKRDEDRKRAIIVVTDNPEVADQMEHCAELEKERRSESLADWCCMPVRKAFFVLVPGSCRFALVCGDTPLKTCHMRYVWQTLSSLESQNRYVAIVLIFLLVS